MTMRDRGHMELNHQEKNLLSYLADEWKNTGPPGYLETKVLAECMDLSVEKTKSVVHSLFVKGLVDLVCQMIYAVIWYFGFIAAIRNKN